MLYRLCGDFNPLHADPNMSILGGYEVPILHGLCTYGISARAVYEQYGEGNPKRLRGMNARFTSHVLPGETLTVEMWKEGNFIRFQTKTKERGKVVVLGIIDLSDQKTKAKL